MFIGEIETGEMPMGGRRWIGPQQSLIWTTSDEINYLKGLADTGRVKVLLNYQRSFAYRDFTGEGMQVNKMEVAKALRIILSKVATIKELAQNQPKGVASDAAVMVRTAKEWLGGGRLRHLAQQRQRDDVAGEGEVSMPESSENSGMARRMGSGSENTEE